MNKIIFFACDFSSNDEAVILIEQIKNDIEREEFLFNEAKENIDRVRDEKSLLEKQQGDLFEEQLKNSDISKKNDNPIIDFIDFEQYKSCFWSKHYFSTGNYFIKTRLDTTAIIIHRVRIVYLIFGLGRSLIDSRPYQFWTQPSTDRPCSRPGSRILQILVGW